MIKDSNKANNKDFNQIMKIVQSWPCHFDKIAYAHIKNDFNNCNKAFFFDNNIVKGFIIWTTNSFEIEILWIAVDPNYLRKGIGSKLINHVIATANSQKIIILKTASTDSEIAGSQFEGIVYSGTNAFFKVLNFQHVCKIKSYWGLHNHCNIYKKNI